VARLKDVYVLDIHTLTYLFPYHIFLKVMNLLNKSYIFAINMGEDDGIFEDKHFAIIASKIEDGSSAIRRWFVKIHGNRRDTVIRSGLVSKVHTKVFLTRTCLQRPGGLISSYGAKDVAMSQGCHG
jgi:hypothetical protein